MAEEVNSKAPGCGFHRKPTRSSIAKPIGRRGRTPRHVHHGESRIAGSGDAAFATPRDCGVHLSRYRATTCRMGFHEARRAIRTNDRKMSSHLLAQHDKRESEHDGRGDHGSELGKYRPESARSELQCLAPCSPTKIVHVGLHVATSCRAHRPATAGARPSKW